MAISKRFVNEYEYTFEFVKEAISAWWERKLKGLQIIMFLLLFTMVILFLITQKIIWLTLALLFVVPIILISFKKKIAIKTELDRISVLYKEEIPIIKVILDKNIHIITAKGERSIEFSSIQSFSETQNLIVLMVKGNMTIAFSKNGFIEGNSEDFLIHIKKIIGKKN